MSFIEETKKELVLAYFQLVIVIILGIVFILIHALLVENYSVTGLWLIIGVFGFLLLISIARVVLLHLSIYYWKRGD